MTKIYLSPSSQSENACSGGDTEAVHCRKIAESAQKYLKNNGYSVKLATEGKDINGRIKESNSFGADVHIPIHTNAGGGDGTLVLCYIGCMSNTYVKHIYNELAKISPGSDDGIKVRTDLAEITGTKAMCVYVECEFHDAYGAWIDKNTDALGKAIVKGVCKAEGKTFKELSTVSTSDANGAIYKVQIGAFKKLSNAESLANKAVKCGFETYIYPDDGLYRVQVGAYAKYSNAESIAKKLESKGFETYIYKS